MIQDGLQKKIPPICDMCPTLIDASTCTEHDGLYLCPRCSAAAYAEVADAEAPIVCEVCGNAEGCICFTKNGIQKIMCVDCIPKEDRAKAFMEWESDILSDCDETEVEIPRNIPFLDPSIFRALDEFPDLTEVAGPHLHNMHIS